MRVLTTAYVSALVMLIVDMHPGHFAVIVWYVCVGGSGTALNADPLQSATPVDTLLATSDQIITEGMRVDVQCGNYTPAVKGWYLLGCGS